MTSSFSNFVSNYNQAVVRRKLFFKTSADRLSLQVLPFLFSLNYISSYTVENGTITIGIRYIAGEPVLRRLSRVSKSSKRVYCNQRDYATVNSVVSSSQSILVYIGKGQKFTFSGEILLQLS